MRAASTVVSLTTHVGLVVAAMWATAAVHPRVPSPPVVILDPPPSGTNRAPAPAPPSAPLIDGDMSLPPLELPRVDGVDVDGATSVLERWALPGPDFARTPAGDGGAEPLDPSVVDQLPVILAGPVPAYPQTLRQAGVEGRVVLEAVVDTAGHVEPGSLVTIAAAHPGLVAPAQQAVAASLFRPARVHGRAVRVRVRIPIDFALRR